MKEKKGIVDSRDLLQYMDAIVQSKKKAGKNGTANVYRTVRNHLALFCDKESKDINNLNASVVESLREYFQSCGLSANSISNYLSVLRAVYNKGIADNLIKSDGHSFHKMKLHPVSTYKRAVPMDVIMEITALKLVEPRLIFTRDIFLFSFMACGISFVDLSHLRRANIIGNTLVYRRIKTKTEIRVVITSGMRCLINHYSNTKSDYLFPILKGGETYEQYKVALRTYNRRLNEISKLLPSPVKLTSYTARHSWAMQAKVNDVPVAVIGEALGHTSERTTRFYLSNLDQSVLDEANRKIITRVDLWVVNTNIKVDPCL